MNESDRAQEEALRFARVWKRVAPDGGGVVLPALQAPPEEEPPPEPEDSFFRRQVAQELALGRAARRLARRTGAAELYDCALCASQRGRRLAAFCYLEGGSWLLEGQDACPDTAEPGREGLRQLYQMLAALSLRYRTQQERTRQDALAALCFESGAECRRWQGRLRTLLAQWCGG